MKKMDHKFLQQIDLSSVERLGSAGDPVDHKVMKELLYILTQYSGLKREAFVPCYGLAETQGRSRSTDPRFFTLTLNHSIGNRSFDSSRKVMVPLLFMAVERFGMIILFLLTRGAKNWRRILWEKSG